MPSVFISYSHDSDAHRDFVRGIADRLRQDGVDCRIDQYINGFPEQGWQRWMEDQIEAADFVLLVCTETYLRRFRGHETQGGKGVNFEGVVISQVLYDNYYKNTRFIPTIPNNGSFDHVPVPLRPYSTYRLDNQYDDVYRIIIGQAKYQQPDLGAIRQLPPTHTESSHKIYSDDLPTVEGELFGRKDELVLLDQALTDSNKNIVQFVASGGTGKTKLIRTWLDDNTEKIDNLIAWSFYSQGSSEDKQISATPFFMQALKSLGSDKDISDFNTEEEKGEHIADLLREQRCLLVLDGLEPLQQVGRGMRGELKDRAIRKLLRCLVGSHSSLCIITTRLPVHELKDRRRVVQHDLQNLAPEDGVALLQSFGVSGRDADMLAAVEEYGRHALALHLLGNALSTYLDGDVRKRDKLGELIGDYDDVERHAFKVMQAYEHWLEGTVELKLLYLLGLFDHPVEQGVLEVLWEAEIPGLTEGVDKRAWLVARKNLLEKLKMLSSHEIPSVSPKQRLKSETFETKGSTLQNNHDISGGPPTLQKGERGGFSGSDIYDCHPLIREYFGRRLKESQGEVWQQAHTALYEYYKELPEKLWGKYLPDTLEEMQPLFRAVFHGCNAGMHKHAISDILWIRVKRKKKHYLTKKLNAFNDDLSMIINFFITPWRTTVENIPKNFRHGILSWAGYNLLSLGRLDEALEPTQKSIEILKKQGDTIQQAAQLYTLSELRLTLGLVDKAIEDAKLAINCADNSGQLFECTSAYSSLANALHQSGNRDSSLEFFRKAESYQLKDQYYYPKLYTLSGYQYCDLLLAQNAYDEVLQRSEYALEIAQENFSTLDIALNQIIIGRARAQTGSLADALEWLAKAMKNLCYIGDKTVIPQGLLIQAELYRKTNKPHITSQKLQEAYEIAEPSGMRLHLTDYHLEMARLILVVEADPTQYPEATPDREQRILPFADQEEPGILTLGGHIAEADRLIQETGYHRRDAELAELKQALEKS